MGFQSGRSPDVSRDVQISPLSILPSPSRLFAHTETARLPPVRNPTPNLPQVVPVPSMEFPSRNPRKSHPPQLPAAYRPHQRTCPLRPTHLWVARRGLFLSATFRPSTKTHTSEAVAPETRGRWLSGCTHPRGGCIAFLKCVWCRVMSGKTCRWYDTMHYECTEKRRADSKQVSVGGA